MIVALVGCGARKLATAAQARELYRGGLFRTGIAAALRIADRVFIVSAEHGLVELEQRLEPYDRSLGAMSAAERGRWGRKVADQMIGTGIGAERVIALMGETYARPLRQAFAEVGWPAPEEPLHKVRGCGRRIDRLKELVR